MPEERSLLEDPFGRDGVEECSADDEVPRVDHLAVEIDELVCEELRATRGVQRVVLREGLKGAGGNLRWRPSRSLRDDVLGADFSREDCELLSRLHDALEDLDLMHRLILMLILIPPK